MKKTLSTIILGVAAFCSAHSQQFNNLAALDNLLQMYSASAENGAQDAEQVLTGYLSPLMKSIGFGLSNAWVNTAATHQPLGFDITLTVNTVFVPEEDLTYTIGPLKEVELTSPADGQVPTIFGSYVKPAFRHNTTNKTFYGPGGLDIAPYTGNMVPIPMLQAGVGIIKGTEAKIRFMPPYNNSQYGLKVNMLGLGGVHELQGYLGMEDESVKISGFAGFTRFNFKADLSDDKDGSKMALFHVNSITAQLAASKTFTIFTVYSTVGVTQSVLNTAFTGGYSIDNDPSTIEVTDPLDMTFGSMGPRATLGFQMRFVSVAMHVDYTFQKYNTLTAGLGVSIK